MAEISIVYLKIIQKIPLVPQASDEVFHEYNGTGLGCLPSLAQSWSREVCPWKGQCAVSCLPPSPRGRLSVHLLSWKPARKCEGRYCCRWKKKQSHCTPGLQISKDSLSEAMGTHGTTVPLETRVEIFINQWNNVQHRHGEWCGGVWVGVLPPVLFWSVFHFVLELLSEK